jgi:hypothetical protein
MGIRLVLRLNSGDVSTNEEWSENAGEDSARTDRCEIVISQDLKWSVAVS